MIWGSVGPHGASRLSSSPPPVVVATVLYTVLCTAIYTVLYTVIYTLLYPVLCTVLYTVLYTVPIRMTCLSERWAPDGPIRATGL